MKRKELTAMLLAVTVALTACGGAAAQGGAAPADGEQAGSAEEALQRWNEIKKAEKSGKEAAEKYLPDAFEEAKELIDVARRRKHIIH